MIEHRKMVTCFMNGKSCIYERAIDERLEEIRNATGDKRTFVIMPFDPHLDALYQWQILPFLKQGGSTQDKNHKYDVVERADDVRQVGFIVCEKICRKIQEADLIVVDLTYNNPNVFYELGIGVALNKPVLPICLKDNIDNRTSELDKYVGISKPLPCPTFDLLEGNITEYLMDVSRFTSFTGLAGTNLIVLHDGKKIKNDIRGEQLNYKFARLCKSAAGTAIEQIFEDDNVKRHPELDSYTDHTKYKKINDYNLNNSSCLEVLEALSNCYCALIDTSSICPATYFWLGFIHAKGGFAIPINTVKQQHNVAVNGKYPPFDIRALWHIYYEEGRPIELVNSLKNILEFVFIEKSKRLHREEFWKKICEANRVSIFLGSRNISQLGRNTIGDWDYRAAAELTSFLSREKETMEVTLESPIQKVLEKPDKEHIQWLKSQLCDKNCIIIASSDVNDLTEIALAELWKKPPFSPLSNDDVHFDDFIAFKSYTDKVDVLPSCVSLRYEENTEVAKRGFILRHGNKTSEKEIVEKHFFPDDKGESGVHTLLGQLIVAPNPFAGQERGKKWMIILNGISGPSTFGIAQMLTGCIYSEFTVNRLSSTAGESEIRIKQLQSWLEKNSHQDAVRSDEKANIRFNIDYGSMSEEKIEKLNSTIGNNGVSAMICVAVYYPEKKVFNDERKIIAWSFKPIFGAGNVERENPRTL